MNNKECVTLSNKLKAANIDLTSPTAAMEVQKIAAEIILEHEKKIEELEDVLRQTRRMAGMPPYHGGGGPY